jgi:hypothetical protein
LPTHVTRLHAEFWGGAFAGQAILLAALGMDVSV